MKQKKEENGHEKLDMGNGPIASMSINLNKKLVGSTTKDDKKKMAGMRLQKAMQKATTETLKTSWRASLKGEYKEHMKIREKDYVVLGEILESTTKRQSEYKQIDEEMNPAS